MKLKEIKETCGFLDLEQNFHKTQKEAEDANVKIKTRQIERKLNNFHVQVSEKWFKTERYYYQMYQNVPTYKVKQKLLEDMCEVILQDSNNLLEILEEKKSLEKELDQLQKLEASSERWWLRLKWW